jgi:hypothetical protein
VLAPNVYFSLGSWPTLVFVVLWSLLGGAAVWRGSYRLRVVTSLLILAAAGTAAILSASSPANGTFFFLAFVTLAAMLWSPRAGAVAAGIAILIVAALAALAGAGLLGASGNVPAMRSLAGWIGASLASALRSGHRCLAALKFAGAATVGYQHPGPSRLPGQHLKRVRPAKVLRLSRFDIARYESRRHLRLISWPFLAEWQGRLVLAVRGSGKRKPFR